MRVLRPSARPLIALSIVTSPLLLLSLALVAKRGLNSASLQYTVAVVLLYAFLAVAVRGMRVAVTDSEITLTQFGVYSRSVQLSTIEHSDVRYLKEAHHPRSLAIYQRGVRAPALTIPLKSFSREDVKWLTAMDALKIVVHEGVTNANKAA